MTPIPACAAAEEEWSFSRTPYLWAMSLDGSVVVNGQAADVAMGFDTLFENLNMGVMVDMRARRGKFASSVYGKVSADKTSAGGAITTSISSGLTFIEVGASCALDPAPLGDGTNSVTFEPYVGARYTLISLDVSINSFSGSAHIEWVDPIIGMRSYWRLADRRQGMVGGDVGGFGLGSEFSWQVLAVAGYDFDVMEWRDGTAFTGYRALGQDYGDRSGAGREEWAVIPHGPLMGLSVRF
jgi:hypothetical protein